MMLRNVVARAGLALCAAAASLGGASAAAQSPTAPDPTAATAARPPRQLRRWNDSVSLALVRRAAALRARQLADTGLVDYRATAQGYLTFLAQLGTGELGEQQFPEPPRIVKSDQLALQVFWKAPSLSKQQIIGRRDTLLLPTDINYHRDHLGIVQNNFPSVIRLGDGDEVLDVPHPLSAAGLAAYDYVIRDSLRIRLTRDRSIDVYEVRVRPKDERQPRAVGAVYVDRSEGQVVRMAFSFTRAALRDRQLEDVSVVLENALVEGRFWLPRRQEIEIRRTGAFMKFPARGIIRGRWEVSDYRVNTGLPAAYFAGPEIVQAPPATLRAYPWRGRLLDSLPPDVRVTTDADVARVQAEARALVRAEALARAEALTLSGGRVSDFARANRVEGLALGLELSRRLGAGFEGTLGGRWGTEDEAAKGHLTIAWRGRTGRGISARAYRTYQEASDEPEVSLVRNSIAAQEFGSDYTEPFDARGAAVGLDIGGLAGLRWRLDGAYERQAPLGVHATPAIGRFEPTIPAERATATWAQLTLDRPAAAGGPLGSSLGARIELRATRFDPHGEGDDVLAARTSVARGFALADAERPFGASRLAVRLTGAYARASAGVPVQDLVFLGGPSSGPGYAFHEFAGELGATARVEWRMPAPIPSVPLGRFGRTPGEATLAPFVHAVYLARPRDVLGRPARAGWFPAVGIGAVTLFDVLRFDVARGLRDGRWTFSVDATRALWGVL